MPDGAPAPRLLTKAQLRAYMGSVTWAEIDHRMQTGRVPAPLWGLEPADPRARWDRRAVDRALDEASGIPASVEQDIDRLDRAFGLR